MVGKNYQPNITDKKFDINAKKGFLQEEMTFSMDRR